MVHIQRSIPAICQWGGDTDRYFAITEFNNCFITQSILKLSNVSDLPFVTQERGYNFSRAEHYLQKIH